jgi:hypothetical protein
MQDASFEEEDTKVVLEDDLLVDSRIGTTWIERNSLLFRSVLIVASEFCERLCFYAIGANLVLFFKDIVLLDLGPANMLYLLWVGTNYVTPVLGGWIADSFLGRYDSNSFASNVNPQVPNYLALYWCLHNWNDWYLHRKCICHFCNSKLDISPRSIYRPFWCVTDSLYCLLILQALEELIPMSLLSAQINLRQLPTLKNSQLKKGMNALLMTTT